MPAYFMVLEPSLYHEVLAPALGDAWRQRRFAPCRALADRLLPRLRTFATQFYTAEAEFLLPRVHSGVPFDRDIWELVAGEALLLAAEEMPALPVAPATLECLVVGRHQDLGKPLGPTWVEQTHAGSRPVRLGPKHYRPGRAGLNDVEDVARIAELLESIHTDAWTPNDLRPLTELDEHDREDELVFAGQCLAGLRGLYAAARDARRLIVCETD